jgi:hypothetical protein
MNANIKQTSSLAIISLVSGILGWTMLPMLGSIVAIITGHMARAEIKRNPDTMEGDGMAIAGLVMGWVMIGLCLLLVIAVIVAIVFFGGLAAVLANSGH